MSAKRDPRRVDSPAAASLRSGLRAQARKELGSKWSYGTAPYTDWLENLAISLIRRYRQKGRKANASD